MPGTYVRPKLGLEGVELVILVIGGDDGGNDDGGSGVAAAAAGLGLFLSHSARLWFSFLCSTDL